MDEVYKKAVAKQIVNERGLVIAQLQSMGIVTVDTEGSSASGRLVEAYKEIKNRCRL